MKTGKTLILAIIYFLTPLSSTVMAQQPHPPAAQLPQASTVGISIAALQDKIGPTGPILFRFSLRNTTDAPLSVLEWGTPLEGFYNDMFKVTVNGKAVPYIGRLVTRRPPQPDDYVTIPPGQAVSTEFDLSKGYAISEAGRYEVVYQHTLQDVKVGSVQNLAVNQMHGFHQVGSNPATFEVTAPRPTIRKESFDLAPSKWWTSNCSYSQDFELTHDGLFYAHNLSVTALEALSGTTDAQRPWAQRYTTWYGAYDSNRYAHALDNFSKITTALNSLEFTCESSCDSSVVAYVYPDQAYMVHLCSPFWSYQWKGSFSKAGVVVHETSHFDAVAGTRDQAYWDSASKQLAISDPNAAVNNADAYRIFAENDPPEPMTEPPIIFSVSSDDDANPFLVPCNERHTIRIEVDSVAEIQDVQFNGQSVNFVIVRHVVDPSRWNIAVTLPVVPNYSGPERILVKTVGGVAVNDILGVQPVLTGVTPSSGPVDGGFLQPTTGIDITINGHCLGSKVYFGNKQGFPKTQCQGNTQCTVTSPTASNDGPVDVTSDADGVRSRIVPEDQFTYTGPFITGMDPSSGPVTGGTWVELTGSGFPPYTGAGNNMDVSFGNVRTSALCLGSTVHTTTSCSVVSPPATQTGPVFIIGSAYGGSSPPDPRVVFTYIDLALSKITCNSSSGDCFVSLNGQAPESGASINLASSDPGVLSVPNTATIPAHASGADVNLTFPPIARAEDVMVTATYQNSSVSTTVHVNAWPALSLKLTPSKLDYQQSAAAMITLNTPAPTGGANITLSSSDPSAVQVLPDVPISAGSNSAAWSLTNNYNGRVKNVAISAVSGTATASAILSVGCQEKECAGCGDWNVEKCACGAPKICRNGGSPDANCECPNCRPVRNQVTSKYISVCQ
jgi:peptidyl-Lys metalloendopeptidase